jgi:hypothetical protein
MNTNDVRYIIIFLLCFWVLPVETRAGDNWFCREQDSALEGDTLRVCGVGDAAQESVARTAAADAAFATARTFCQKSHRCSIQLDSAQPGRLECDRQNGSYHCLKYMELSVAAKESPSFWSRLFGDGDQKKLRNGLSQQTVEALFGDPVESYTAGTGVVVNTYVSDDFCAKVRCVIFLSNGVVSNYSGFKPSSADPN